jgi:hypothetical protein
LEIARSTELQSVHMASSTKQVMDSLQAQPTWDPAPGILPFLRPGG